MVFPGMQMNTAVMGTYETPPGFTEPAGGGGMSCVMDELIALAEVDAQVTPMLQTFVQKANNGMKVYQGQADTSVRDYYDTDANSGLMFDGITPGS